MKDYRNYHNISIGNKIEHDGNLIFETSLNGVEGKNVIIDGLKTKALITSKYNNKFGELKYILARQNEVNRGSLVTYNDEHWLVTTIPNNNGVFKKGEIQLCSATFPLKEDDKKIFIGVDDLKRPVYDIIPGKIVDIPCVVSMNEATIAIADTNKPINLLNNVVYITIPYTESESIGYDKEFEMYGSIYRIIRIDISKSINKVGLTKITAEVKGFKKGGNNE